MTQNYLISCILSMMLQWVGTLTELGLELNVISCHWGGQPGYVWFQFNNQVLLQIIRLYYFSPHNSIYRKNSFSRVVFLSVYFCQLVLFLNKRSNSAVRTKDPQAVGPGSNLCWVIYFYDFTDICQKFQRLPWHPWTGQQGSQALGTSSNFNIYL